MSTYNKSDIEIKKDFNEPMHLHPDVELLYVIDGTIQVKIKDSGIELQKDDILVINSSLQHSLTSGANTIICAIKLDYQMLVQILKKPNIYFICNSVVDTSKSYLKLRMLCRDIIYYEVVGRRKTDSLKYSLIYQLLDELVENYMFDDCNSELAENYDADEKLQIIIHYVHQNYQDGISLSELASQMYTSTSTLSRLFKKQTGIYFAEYVNQVRTRYAVDELLYTNKNMTRIALDCGFSNPSAFTKVFREIYQMSPSEYRQMFSGMEQKKKVIDKDIVTKIKEEYRKKDETPSMHKKYQVHVIDVKQAEDFKRNWNQAINVGFVHDILNANNQYHIVYLAKGLGFKYARIWMVFNTKTMVSDGKTIGNYNFDMIFEALDFMVENHIKPWLDFTNRPYANVRNSDETVWFEDIRVKFEDKRVWQDMYKAFFKNIVRRYGEKEVSTWKFEIGLEGFHKSYDDFYLSDDFSFTDMYSYFSKLLKEIVPEAQVGYSAGAGIADERNFESILRSLTECMFPPDFVSVLMFPYEPNMGRNGGNSDGGFIRSKDTEFVKNELARIYAVMDRLKLDRNKVIVSEWNLTASNSNFLNDSSFRGCVLLNDVINFAKDVDVFGIWMSTDWLCNSFNTRNVINGGGGLLTKDTIRKPVYFAIDMLNKLGTKVVQRGENYIVTRVATDEYRIICFNPVWYSIDYFINAENQSRVDEVKNYFDLSAKKKFTLKLEGVGENTWYIVKRRSVNESHGSIIGEWGRFGNDSHLERSDIKYLQEMCVPGITRTKIMTQGNTLTLDIEMEAEEFCSFHIFSEY